MIRPLTFIERVAYGSEVDGRFEQAQIAAAAFEAEARASGDPNMAFDAESLPGRFQSARTRPKCSRIAGLSSKQGDILSSLLCEGPLTSRELEADLGRHAWASGWKDWSASGIAMTLRRMEHKGLVVRVPESAPIRWNLTEQGSDAQAKWLDAQDKWWDENVGDESSDAPA